MPDSKFVKNQVRSRTHVQEVTSWEELGQWCWVQMLFLKCAWQSAPFFCRELPSVESEKSIDNDVKSMLCNPANCAGMSEESKPWILKRLLFGSGLLQPCVLRLLDIPNLSNPTNALRFILLEEWYNSGRDVWTGICDVINDPRKASPSRRRDPEWRAKQLCRSADAVSMG